jgi:3-oxoacyl-[acyl-carrier-protein] synthase-3
MPSKISDARPAHKAQAASTADGNVRNGACTWARITGTGSALPQRRVTNQELVAQLARDGIESSDDWIVERTGIRARHFAGPGETTSSLAVQAARQAMDAAGVGPKDIDLIICATTTPDMVFPATACLIQHQLGIGTCPAFDVQAVCSGFVYALTVADAMIRAGNARRALVIGAELFSRLLDFKDRSTCVLFGDGAGAVVLEAADQPGILAASLHADGSRVDLLNVPSHTPDGGWLAHPTVHMDGQGVFKLAVNLLESAAHEVLEKAGVLQESIDWLVPHQANLRIMQSTAKKLKLTSDKIIVTVDQHGNTSAASVPLALDHGVRSGSIQRGQRLLLEGVGGGFTWGAVLLDF